MPRCGCSPASGTTSVLFVASVVIAIAASSVALWIARTLSDADQRHMIAKRLGAAVVMGIAITGMHYTGSAAAAFPLGSICGAANGIDGHWLAVTITLFTFAILIVTLMLSRFDARTTLAGRFGVVLNGQIVRMATFDTLTDLPNRRTLTKRIEHAIQTARQQQNLFAILFMDLDGFKTINDSLRPASYGDEVLKAFAQRHCCIAYAVATPSPDWAAMNSWCCSKTSRRRRTPATWPKACLNGCARVSGQTASPCR